MYSLFNYGEMIADCVRLEAYTKAIEKTVRPGDAVVDLGCGPGLFAFLACRAGARKVYAIDADGIVEVGREIAKANCLANRIEFLEGDSERIKLPERVNVIVSDIRGTLPLYGQALLSIEDARLRFLAPGGVLVPQRDTLKAAVIEAEGFYARIVSPWRAIAPGLDLSPVVRFALNVVHGGKFKAEQLLTEPQSWCVLDYAAGPSSHIHGELNVRAARGGTAHGMCLWFEAQLCEGIGYSSGPGSGSTIYGQIFLPWLEPVPVVEGQEIQVELHADLVGADYVWRWETKIPAAGKRTGRHFQQSTFEGAVFSPQSLRRCTLDYVPALSEAGHAESWLLQAMDGSATLNEIAQAAAQRFPQVFPSSKEAFQRATELSERFCR